MGRTRREGAMTTTRAGLLGELRRQFGDRFHDRPEDLLVYECDAAALYKERPLAVVFPESTEEVATLVRLCNESGLRCMRATGWSRC